MEKRIKTESLSEKNARKIVEKYFNTELEFQDFDGRVDFVSVTNSTLDIALEVTSFVDPNKMELDKLDFSRQSFIRTNSIRRNWFFSVRGIPNFRKFKKEVIPLIPVIEMHGIEKIVMSEHSWWMETVETLKRVFQILKNNKIDSMNSNIGVLKDQNIDEERLVIISYSENWVYEGEMSLLEPIEEFIWSDENNLMKLKNSGRESRHLFIWFNENTRKSVREFFEEAKFTLPSSALQLPDEITDLWISDYVTGNVLHFCNLYNWRAFRILDVLDK